MHKIDRNLLEEITERILRDVPAPDWDRFVGGRGAPPVERFVILSLMRRTCGDQFEEVRRRQVERLGNRPSLDELRAAIPALEGCVTVATCCRFEIHGVLHASAIDSLARLAAEMLRLLGLPEEQTGLVAVMRGREALRHLLWTTIGGDSVLPGETEILGQMKTAYRLAIEDGHIRRAPILHHIYQRMFRQAHRIRLDHFGAGGWSSSLPRLAVNRMLSALHGASPSDKRLAVVGAGSVALDLAYYCEREGIAADRLTFFVRNSERARRRHGFPPAAETRPVESLVEELTTGGYVGVFGAVTHPLARPGTPEEWARVTVSLPVVDLSVPTMLEDGLIGALPDRVDYIDFEALMEERHASRASAQDRLESARRAVDELSSTLTKEVERREQLRGVELQSVRSELRERVENLLAGQLGEALRGGDRNRGDGESDAFDRRLRALQRRLAGLVQYHALEILKDHLLTEAARKRTQREIDD